MSRRTLATISLATALLAGAGCLSLDDFPRLRSLWHGNGCCPPSVAYDAEGPILEGDQVGAPGPSPLPAEGMAPQPRLVPQPLTQPEAEPTPYKPTKKGK